jgi:hypothetical protein
LSIIAQTGNPKTFLVVHKESRNSFINEFPILYTETADGFPFRKSSVNKPLGVLKQTRSVSRSIEYSTPLFIKYCSALNTNNSLPFWHGGNVQTTEKSDYINTYLDDVFIDYFFRTYKFKEIIFPKGLCHEQITPEGIVHPKEDISLDLNNLYDRCTFANNIFRLFGVDSELKNQFPCNKYIKSLSMGQRIFGLQSWCFVLINDEPIYKMYLDTFINNYYPGHSLERTDHRGQTIKEFVKFVYGKYHTDIFSTFPINHLSSLQKFEDGFSQIRDKKIFGQYTIEEIQSQHQTT